MDVEHENNDINQKHKRKKVITLAATTVATAVEHSNKLFLGKDPYRGETLPGLNDTTCRSQIRMSRRAFFSLCDMVRQRGLLQDSGSLQVEEQMIIFLNTISHSLKNRVLLHNFGYSGETIRKYFNLALGAIIKLYPVLLKSPSTETPHRILDNLEKFFPYFKDCIGAVDGLQIPAWVPTEQYRRFRDRKGNISQNILVACDFDMKYTYILAGWEGSASDSRILDDALHREGEAKIVVPEGKYYLVDAGFGNQTGFLRPYRNVRYHLKEWQDSGLSPANKKELFNLRHSSLRNVIERSFSLLKSRFKILKNQSEYPYKMQVRIVLACVLIHNHILSQHSIEEEEEYFDQENGKESSSTGQAICEDANVEADDVDNDEEVHANVDWEQFREEMAEKMWDDWVVGDQSSEGADDEFTVADN